MNPHHKNRVHCAMSAAACAGMLASMSAFAQGPAVNYVPGSLAESKIFFGPWTLHQSNFGAHYDASGIIPTPPGPPFVGSGTPYANYCDSSGNHVPNFARSLMQPYYFPFVRQAEDGVLEGLFDYRPRNEQEATVAAVSFDEGRNWFFAGQALGLNDYCPADSTDPDNLNVIANGVVVPYGSSAANAGDNGLGHSFALRVAGKLRIYQLNRADGHIDSDQLVVHTLHQDDDGVAINRLPRLGYVSPLGSLGYPTLESTAESTAGLVNPDAILGAITRDDTHIVVYVSKTLNGDTAFPKNQQCGKTPAFALPNILNHGKGRNANHDITAVRVAVTEDGINFTDLGSAATGLNDPTTTAFNSIRWLGSGSLIALADGRYGMFFGAGNCLDNDSDGFHFIGYAETDAVVRKPADLLAWHIVNGLDNPVLSTDTLTDTTTTPARVYPLNPPLVDVTGADELSAAQVAPFSAPAGYATNFFSGRAYDPQAVVSGEDTVTIVFAGYNTPQPSLNLGDYRTIGRFKLKFPADYLKSHERSGD